MRGFPQDERREEQASYRGKALSPQAAWRLGARSWGLEIPGAPQLAEGQGTTASASAGLLCWFRSCLGLCLPPTATSPATPGPPPPTKDSRDFQTAVWLLSTPGALSVAVPHLTMGSATLPPGHRWDSEEPRDRATWLGSQGRGSGSLSAPILPLTTRLWLFTPTKP